MIEVLTGILVIVTGFYALVTYKILMANSDAVSEMRTQNQNYSRPLVQPTLFVRESTNLFGLRIRNNGLSTAKGVRISIDRDFFTFGEQKESNNLRHMSAFREPIASFGPGAEVEFLLVQAPVVFADDADQNIVPIKFEVKIEYAFSDKKVCEETTIDFRPYRHANIPQNEVANELKKIHKALEALGELFKKQ